MCIDPNEFFTKKFNKETKNFEKCHILYTILLLLSHSICTNSLLNKFNRSIFKSEKLDLQLAITLYQIMRP